MNDFRIESNEKIIFSIITVVYNAVETVEETVKSVLDQTDTSYEYIVIDGNSCDGTKEILEKYQNHFSLYLSEPDNGLYNAMNKALNYVHGEYVFFLNADDVFYDDHVIRRLKKLLSEKNNPDLFYGAVIADYGDYWTKVETEFGKKQLRFGIMPCHQGIFLKIGLLKFFEGFNCIFNTASDFDLMCRLAAKTTNIKKVEICITVVRMGGISSKKEVTYSEKYQIINKYFGKYWAISYYIRKIWFEQGLKKILLCLQLNWLYKFLLRINLSMKRK